MPKPSLKEAFIDAGMSEFHENGYSATGVSSIAKRAGGPKGSFYNHFSSKQELAIAVVERYAEGRRIGLLSDASRSPLARIEEHFEHLRSDLAQYGYHRGCMFGNLAAESRATASDLGDVIDRALEIWRAALTDAIAAARDAGEITQSVDPELAASLLVDAWEGAAMRAKSTGNSVPIDNVMDFAFSRLLVLDRA